MFAVSELYFKKETSAIRFFKPWWDLIADYLTMGLLILTLVAFTRVTLIDGSGINCVGVTDDYDWFTSKYASARCSYTFEGKTVIYFPHMLLLQWGFISVIHHGWLVLPAFFSKLEAFYQIFIQMCQIRPMYYRNPNTFQMASELAYGSQNIEMISVLHCKLLYLLTDNSFLVTTYKIKMVALFVFSVADTLAVISVLVRLSHFPLNFPCKLPANDNAIELVDLACHVSSAIFLYGLMLLNILLVFLIMSVAFKGLVWLIRQQVNIDYKEFLGSFCEYYEGMPGFRDFIFCLLLVRENIHDGQIMFQTIKACINGQDKKFKRMKYVRRGTTENKNTLIVPRKVLEDSRHFVKWIADQLGLEEVRNTQNPNHLFDCISFIRDSFGEVEFDVKKSMRTLIVEEIAQNPLHFKTIIDKEPSAVKYEQFANYLKDPYVFGRQYTLMAAANLLQVRLVIIHCHPSKRVKEVFIPYKDGEQCPKDIKGTRFLTFVSPHFYHATVDLPLTSDWPSIITKRNMYATDSRFRADMRNAAVRCVSSLNISQSNGKINAYFVTEGDDVTTIEMPVMGVKRARKFQDKDSEFNSNELT